MFVLIAITFFAHLILPFLFLYWIAFNKGKSIAYRLSVAVFVASYFMIMGIAGAGWYWFGFFWPVVYLVLFIPCIFLMFKKSKNLNWLPEKKFMPWLNFVIMGSLAVLFLSSLPELFNVANFSQDDQIELEFPLKNGSYYAVHGGTSESMNHHYAVEAQKYALDIVKVNGWGVRAFGLMPKELEAYMIYGEVVYSPCTGEIISLENTMVDHTPPDTDRENVLGNHVVIYCNGVSVLLAHLKKGSLKQVLGEIVESGQPLGNIGNSGNTSEPHLHIHAVSGRVSEMKEVAWKAKGVPMIFNGRFLVRNDRFNN